jgi:hypothetical protein
MRTQTASLIVVSTYYYSTLRHQHAELQAECAMNGDDDVRGWTLFRFIRTSIRALYDLKRSASAIDFVVIHGKPELSYPTPPFDSCVFINYGRSVRYHRNP